MIYVEDIKEPEKKPDITDNLAESGFQVASNYAETVTCPECVFGENGVCEEYFRKCIGGYYGKADKKDTTKTEASV